MSGMISPAMRTLSALLEARTGQQLATGRIWRIETSLKPLMRERGISDIEQLVAVLGCPGERDLADDVVDALLNNETFFFRDHAVFQMLDTQALELLREARGAKRRIRIWCAGCSTGQEVYSLAMMLADNEARWAGWTIDILGTDISGGAIERAQLGLYSQFEIQRGLPIRMMMRWFDQEGESWQATRKLKRLAQFRRHNVLDRPPLPGRFDLVLCRNVLLYFPAEVRTHAFDRIASAIEPDGVLMLGAGETVLGQTTKFVSERSLRGLYRPIEGQPASKAA